MDLGEGGLRITEASGTKVQEIVTLVSQAVKIAALVASLMGRVDSQGLVLLHVRKPTAEIKFHQVSSYEVLYTSPTAPYHPNTFGCFTMSSTQTHHKHHVSVSLVLIVYGAAVSWW